MPEISNEKNSSSEIFKEKNFAPKIQGEIPPLKILDKQIPG